MAADESIIVEVTDKVAETPADKFREMAKEALAAQTEIDKLQRSLNNVGKNQTQIVKLATEQSRLEQQLARTAQAQAKAEAEQLKLNRAKEQGAKATKAVTEATRQQAETEAQAMARLRAVGQQTIDRINQQNALAESMRNRQRVERDSVKLTEEQLANNARLEASNRRINREYVQGMLGNEAAQDKTGRAAKRLANELAGVQRESRLTRSQINDLRYAFAEMLNGAAGGMGPFSVAMNRALQLSHSFSDELGGIVPKSAAMRVGIGGAAAAVIALVAAYESARNESARLNNLLNVTGNYAGLTEDSFRSMSEAVAEYTRKSVSEAREVSTALIASGQMQRNEIEQNTASILRLSRLTGTASSEISQSFQRMAQAPSQFAEEMNRQFHFLSSAQLTQIRLLEEMGDKSGAMQIASKALYDYLGNVPAESLGPLSSAWNQVERSISNAWTSLKDFVNGTNGEEKRIAELQGRIADLQKPGAIRPFWVTTSVLPELKDELALLLDRKKARQDDIDMQQEQGRIQQEGYDSSKRLANEWNNIGDNASRANKEIEKFRADIERTLKANPNDEFGKYAKANQSRIEEEIRKRYQPQGTKQEESRSKALQKINAELDKQVNGLGMLRPQREIQQAMDQYEIDLAQKKITLNESERASLEDKLRTIQEYNRVQEATDRIYEEVNAPAQEYQATLKAINVLVAQGALTQAQATQQIQKAELAYRRSIDPLLEINRGISEQMELLRLAQPEREIAQQMQQVENTLRAQGIQLSKEENEQLRLRFEQLQRMTQAQQAYDQIYAQTAGAQESIKYQIEATTRAYNEGLISAEMYTARVNQLSIQAANLRIAAGQALDGDAMLASFGRLLDGYNGMLSGLTNSFGDFFVSIQDGFADSIAGAIMGTESLGDALRNVATNAVQQLLSSLIKLGIQYAVNAAIGNSIGAASTAASVGMAATTAAAWAPAAAFASLASFGANAAPASAGITSTVALSSGLAMAGFRDGGYTGDVGRNNVAGVVHGNEFVFDAASTARLGVGNLQALMDGRAGSSQVASMASTGSAFKASVGNGGGVKVNLTLINNGAPMEAKIESQEDDGQGNIDIIASFNTIENMLAERIRSGRGPANSAIKDTYGLSNKPVGR